MINRRAKPYRSKKRGSSQMSAEKDAGFDSSELSERIRDLRRRFDEFRGRL